MNERHKRSLICLSLLPSSLLSSLHLPINCFFQNPFQLPTKPCLSHLWISSSLQKLKHLFIPIHLQRKTSLHSNLYSEEILRRTKSWVLFFSTFSIMGNRLICMSIKDVREIGSKKSKRRETGSSSSVKQQQQHKKEAQEELLHRPQEAITPMGDEEVHPEKRLSQSLRFDTSSMPGRIGPKSVCRTRRTLSDPFSNEKQLPDFMENMKMKKFVLIHGEGFGAWCWYKTIALLEEAGMLSIAFDLKGSGIDQTDTNSVTTVADYAKPLIDYLHNLPEDDEDEEKVILVGHSCGGAVISHALECYPEKISKAVFVCATMVSDGQKPFDVFSEKLRSAEIFIKESPFLVYGNGRDNAPTSLMLHKQQMKGLYFNQTPVKDIALANQSMRAIPLGPIMEPLSLSQTNYGKGRRFYIQTDVNDNILSPDIQHKLIEENPPEQVYKIKGSDHCPFFSKPQSLHRILLEIARIP